MKIRTALTICTIAAAVAAPVAGAKGLAAAQTDGVKTESLVLGIWEGLAFKPEVEGIATGDGMSQAACDAYAGLIADYIQDAIDAADVDDVGTALDKLERAEAVEDAALNDGCGISYPV